MEFMKTSVTMCHLSPSAPIRILCWWVLTSSPRVARLPPSWEGGWLQLLAGFVVECWYVHRVESWKFGAKIDILWKTDSPPMEGEYLDSFSQILVFFYTLNRCNLPVRSLSLDISLHTPARRPATIYAIPFVARPGCFRVVQLLPSVPRAR